MNRADRAVGDLRAAQVVGIAVHDGDLDRRPCREGGVATIANGKAVILPVVTSRADAEVYTGADGGGKGPPWLISHAFVGRIIAMVLRLAAVESVVRNRIAIAFLRIAIEAATFGSATILLALEASGSIPPFIGVALEGEAVP